MRTFALGFATIALSAALGGCAVEAGDPVSEEARGEIQRGDETSVSAAGTSTPPPESSTSGTGLPIVQSYKSAGPSGKPGVDSVEPTPLPWKKDGTGSNGSSGQGAQKKDGPLHTTIRDMIEPPDGKNP